MHLASCRSLTSPTNSSDEAIAEAPIDALSLAVLEDMRADTLYAATGGGIGPGTIEVLTDILAQLSATSDALVASAADANIAGDRYAVRHAELASAVGVRFVDSGLRKALTGMTSCNASGGHKAPSRPSSACWVGCSVWNRRLHSAAQSTVLAPLDVGHRTTAVADVRRELLHDEHGDAGRVGSPPRLR